MTYITERNLKEIKNIMTELETSPLTHTDTNK